MIDFIEMFISFIGKFLDIYAKKLFEMYSEETFGSRLYNNNYVCCRNEAEDDEKKQLRTPSINPTLSRVKWIII